MISYTQSTLNLNNKNIFVLILILSIFHFTTSSLSNFLDFNVYPKNTSLNQKINRVKSSVIFDKNEQSCDLQISEKVLFSFTEPTNLINHVIFSRRFSYYGFQFKIVNHSGKYVGAKSELPGCDFWNHLNAELVINAIEIYTQRCRIFVSIAN